MVIRLRADKPSCPAGQDCLVMVTIGRDAVRTSRFQIAGAQDLALRH